MNETQVIPDLTGIELDSLAKSGSEAEWNACCDRIKSVRGGEYPRDWFRKVVMSGLAARVSASWTH